MKLHIQRSLLKQLFALLSFFSDKTNGFALFSKGKIMVGSLLLATSMAPLYAQKNSSKHGKQELPPALIPKKDTVVDDEILCYAIVEQMPEFKGGEKALYKFINENIKYPKEAIEKKEQGRVICRFCITNNGSINKISILRGVSPSLDKEAIRLIKSMPKWIPGKQGGKPSTVWYTIPLVFELPKN